MPKEATKKTIKGARKGVEKKPEGKFEDQVSRFLVIIPLADNLIG